MSTMISFIGYFEPGANVFCVPILQNVRRFKLPLRKICKLEWSIIQAVKGAVSANETR